jgi:hypothetical protein
MMLAPSRLQCAHWFNIEGKEVHLPLLNNVQFAPPNYTMVYADSGGHHSTKEYENQHYPQVQS